MIKKFIPALAAILLLASACNIVGNDSVNNTAVAQTVAAIEGGASGGSTSPTTAPVTGSSPEPSTAIPTWTPVPTVAATATLTNTPIPCNLATLTSETVPDDSEINVNASFVKTWTLKNLGSCVWTSGYRVVFASGDAMAGPASFQVTSGTVSPGESVVVSVNLVAPAATGTYRGNWKLQDGQGNVFGLTTGNPFWVQIKAVSSGGLDFHIIPIIPLLPISLISSEQIFNQVSINAGSTGSATATCPSGSIVVGGGFASNAGLIAYTSMMEGNSWKVYGSNTAGSTGLLNAYAICLHTTTGTTTQVYSQVSMAAGGIGHAVVNCPSGSVPTGGGWAGNDRINIYNSNNTGSGWEVYAKSKSGSSELLNAYAICLSGTSSTVEQKGKQVTIGANASDGSSVGCPSGTYVTGGGFAMNGDAFIYNTSMTSDSKGWQTYATNPAATSNLLNIYATCLTFH